MLEMAKTPAVAKILILESNKIKRLTWQNSFRKNSNLNIIGVANNPTEAFYLMELLTPDIVIIDLVYMGIKGIETINKIKEFNRNIKVIALSTGENKNEIIESIRSGINAFCLSNIETESLALIIKTVLRGACWFDPVVMPTLSSFFAKQNSKDNELKAPLSEREMQVLKLLVKGKSNTVIAEELIVSVHTAKAHVCNILHKLNVTDRVQAAVKAVSINLV